MGSAPELQNIPMPQTEEGRRLRAAFKTQLFGPYHPRRTSVKGTSMTHNEVILLLEHLLREMRDDKVKHEKEDAQLDRFRELSLIWHENAVGLQEHDLENAEKFDKARDMEIHALQSIADSLKTIASIMSKRGE